TPSFFATHRTAPNMPRLAPILAAASFVLLAVAKCDPIADTEATPARQTLNASRILDSINKDLEEIKRTLAQAQESRSRIVSSTFSGVTEKSSPGNKFSSQAGHYLSLDQETK